MSSQIILQLKSKLDEVLASSEATTVDIKRNALKEELQYYVLDFIYHHPQYSNWIMYGGSVLRICHQLDRMSVDLDFEINDECTDSFLVRLKSEVEAHFLDKYGVNGDLLSIKVVNGRGLRLNFHIGKVLNVGHDSNQIHVKIDLNHFKIEKDVIERIPINRDQFSFVIKTYNMSTLMASKLAAIFLRGVRGVGHDLFNEKGRDIYDLLWYMEKKVIPDIDYLKAKDVNVTDLHDVFDKLTVKMNDVDDRNLEQDLNPLFYDSAKIENWLKNWRQSYLHLLGSYHIERVSDLDEIRVGADFMTDIFSFIYDYNTEEGGLARFVFKISDYWLEFSGGNLTIEADKQLESFLILSDNLKEVSPAVKGKILQYATLFRNKIESYLVKTKREIFNNVITTKVIRMTADNLNRKEQIVLTKSALLSCELGDLLK